VKLTDDIHRIDGINGVNAYAVLGDDGVTMVDTGFPGKAGVILEYLRGLGYEPGDVHTIVLTHGDTDHVGSAAALKEATGARIAIHEADAPALTGAPYQRATGLSGAIFGAMRAVWRSKPVEPDILLHDGDTISGFRVHHWAGHTPGSIVLERDDGVVFSGDTLLGGKDGTATQPTKGLAHDYDQLRASAKAVEDTHYTLLLPGHFDPVRAAHPDDTASP
jgi:glyoxylase-like metal-dependent hydrolase (beta-lactamase superfamily II)